MAIYKICIEKFNLRALLLSHAIILAILTIVLFPYTRNILSALDRWCFYALNGSLDGSPSWQLFWALANHKVADWIHDTVFLGLIILAVLAVPKRERLQKIAQFIFSGICIAAVIYWINRGLFRENPACGRLSPSLELPDAIRLSPIFPTLHVKDASSQSFPGDHATTALLFGLYYHYYAHKKLALLGWLYAILICLPRLVVGAHWLSDVVIGSGSIALFFSSWVLYSPLGFYATGLIERLLRGCKQWIWHRYSEPT
jgi:membrane-associated phospholipid phosphatase